jgi:hypothetical protein
MHEHVLIEGSSMITGGTSQDMCLAPIDAFIPIIPASSNSCISLPFIIFGLPSLAVLKILDSARGQDMD